MTVGIDVAWTKMINPELRDLAEGKLTLRQTPEELHLNHNGDMNAGVIFSMSEMAGMGVVVMLLGELANNALVVVKNVNIDFVQRAQGAIDFTASMSADVQAQVLASAKAGAKVEQVVSVEARNESGELVSRSSVTAVISPNKH